MKFIILSLFVLSIVGQFYGTFSLFSGKKGSIDHFPHAATIHRHGAQHCSGSVLSENIVLTSAHCYIPNLSGLTVSVGTDNCHDTTNEYDVEKFVKHENYSGKSPLNDIAIIKLDRVVKMGNRVWAIELARPEFKLPEGEVVRIAGCGNVDERERKKSAEKLVSADMVVRKCADLEPKFDVDGLFCVDEETKASTCHGDSGVGYVYNWTLVGVGSQGPGVCGESHVSAGTLVSVYTKWITDTIKKIGGIPAQVHLDKNN